MRQFLGDPMEWFGADSMPPDEIFLALISDLKKMAPDENDDYYRQLVISDCYLIIGMFRGLSKPPP